MDTFRKIVKKATMTAGALTLATASTLGPAAQAQAKTDSIIPDCYAFSCTGLDPSETDCADDAYTAASKELEGGILELRYSPSCVSNWARYTQYGEETFGTWLREAVGKMGRSGSKAWVWVPGDAPVGSINDTVEGRLDSFGPGDTTWTAMVSGREKVCTSVSILFSTPNRSGMDFDRIEENYDGKCG